jgi:hypothetical protein
MITICFSKLSTSWLYWIGHVDHRYSRDTIMRGARLDVGADLLQLEKETRQRVG